MIDTITLTTTASLQNEVLQRMTRHTTYRNADGSQFNCYGHKREAFQPHIRYTVESEKLTVTIPSVPRFMYKTELIMMDDVMVPPFYFKLRQYLVENLLVQELPPPTSWRVQKMDIYQDFHVGGDVPCYIEALKQVKLPKYKEGNYRNETVYWRSGSKEIKFYDKGICAVDKGERPEFVERCQGLMRFEVGINAQELRRYICSDRLGDVFKEAVILPLLQKHLDYFGVNNLTITTDTEAFQTLCEVYDVDRARKLWGYIIAQEKGLDFKLGRMTEYRYRRDITAAGIAPVAGIKQLPPLVIGKRQSTVSQLAYRIQQRIVA